MSDSWHSYPKVYNFGHPAIAELLDGNVVVQEKVDGSQFSFGRFGNQLLVRSRGRVFDVYAPDNMFQKAAGTVLELADSLTDGWTYRGEYLNKPKHNVLAYDRTPAKNIILFDINDGHEAYMDPGAVEDESARLGLEVVPYYGGGTLDSVDAVAELMDRVSVLGGSKIEGVVVKNYGRFGADGKVLMGKHVSERFKEVKDSDWRQRNPTGGDILADLSGRYQTQARWEKAAQHLREAGSLQNSPRDISALMKEVHRDIDEECAEEIKALLYKWASKKIKRQATRGLPEWWKQRLMELQFGD